MQQTIRPAKGPVHSKVIIPGSKAITQRALVLAALADGVSEISGMCIDEQTITLARALHQLGIVTQLDEKNRSCIIAGGNGKFPKKQANIWCGNKKALVNYLLAALAATPGVFYFDGEKSLRRHSFTFLLDILNRQGIQFIPNDVRKLPLTLIGSDILEGGEINLTNPQISEQIISCLLMIAPFARSPFNFRLAESHNPVPIELTSAIMAEFGVLVHRIHHGQLMVPVPQYYQAKDFSVEADLSLAAYFFAAAVITGGEVTVPFLKHHQAKQQDAKFLTVLEQIGCRIQETHHALTVKGPTEFHGIEISLRHFSHLFVVLSIMALFAKSPSRITHLNNITKIEMNRLLALKTELTNLGAFIETGDNWIKIYPGSIKGGTLDTHHDPKLAMGFAILGLKTPNIILNNTECVSHLFPDFFNQWNKLTEASNINV